jgi:hypothetical protein
MHSWRVVGADISEDLCLDYWNAQAADIEATSTAPTLRMARSWNTILSPKAYCVHAWLRTANVRFSDAQTERIWAIVSAHQACLSIRRIAGALGLCSSRTHQLFTASEAKEIPVWLSQLRQSSGGYASKGRS